MAVPRSPDQTAGDLSAPGSVAIGGYSLRELALRDIVVTSPEHLGSHVVIKAKSVSLHPSWDIFKGAAPACSIQAASATTRLKSLCLSSAARDACERAGTGAEVLQALMPDLVLLQGSPSMWWWIAPG